VSAGRFVTIPNGFDPEDFGGLPPPRDAQPLTLTYAGNIYGGRSPEPLLRALAALREQDAAAAGKLRVRLIGTGSDAWARMCRELGLEKLVSLQDRVPYRQALKALSTSHVALLLASSTMDEQPTKIYEYFCLRKPILAILGRGDLWDFLSSHGARCYTHDDVDGLRAGLLELLGQLAESGRLTPPSPLPGIDDYTRRGAARKLAALLDDCTSVGNTA
jgi:glycosyltransferase involved in cell wall biosynthesis